MKKLLVLVVLAFAATTASFAQDMFTETNADANATTSAATIAPGMKYKQLKYIYNYKEFTPTLTDRYSPGWSGVASFVIPGLGQMICGEVGRGFAWLGGSVGCSIIAGVGSGLAMNGSSGGATISLLASLGLLAIDICAIVDGVRVAKVKNMYEQDLKKGYALDFDLYPSVNYVQTANGTQPTAGFTFAMKF